MKVLVTGSTGFIGRHVVTALLERGHEVIASAHLEDFAVSSAWNGPVTFVSHDISLPQQGLYARFRKPDAMIHLAWPGVTATQDPSHYEVALMQHYFFLKDLITEGLPDVTVAGTCFEYGLQEGCLTETLPAEPVTAYGLAKDVLRRFLEQVQKKQPFSLKWVRPFYMYGEGQPEKSIIPQLHAALEAKLPKFNMSGGEQVRDYLHVKDVADIFAAVATQNDVTGIINCCSGKGVKLKDFVTGYLQSIGKSIELNLGHYPYSPVEPMSFWGDDAKLRRIIGGDKKKR